LSADGFRVLAIAYRDSDARKETYSKDDEQGLVLKGYVAFLDPPKADAKEAIKALTKLGIQFKVLTGDNELVTKKICSEVGLEITGLILGGQVEKMTDAELQEAVKPIFCPDVALQKESVRRASQDNAYVGYLGDG
jgi:Mg2+-importing ATPase